MKHSILVVLLLVMGAGALYGQTRGAEIISPRPNEEICLGASLAIEARYTNLDSMPQTLLVRFRITNIVTGISVYFKSYTIEKAAPGFSVDTTFDPYVTAPNMLSQLGSFFACASIVALDNAGEVIEDWGFADSSCFHIFGIRTTNLPFNDPHNDYSISGEKNIPDQRKWVSLGATVVEGDNETWDPPPPRYEGGDGFGVHHLHSPVLRLDRSDFNGVRYFGALVGDTIMSFPFNLNKQTKLGLTFGFMRSGRHSYPAMFDNDTLLGPETTVFNASKQIVRDGDSLIIEFKDPAASKCSPEKWNRIAAIGGGRDFEFQTAAIFLDNDSNARIRIAGQQTRTLALERYYFDTTFRFRLRLKASDNSQGFIPTDDNDPWYIDNISLAVPRLPELEVSWARVVTPYTKIPYTAAARLPVYVKMKNTTTTVSVAAPIRVSILNAAGDTVYKESLPLVGIAGGQDSVLRFPDWDARTAVNPSSEFRIYAGLAQNGYDSYTDDNETYSKFYLHVERGNGIQEFALDNAGIAPKPGIGNDMVDFARTPGAGIGFGNSSGSMAMKFTLPNADTLLGARLYFGSMSQSADAIRISVLQGDSASCVPGDVINSFETTRHGPYDQYTSYNFPGPVLLPAGTYWLSVSQLGLDNFTLGANFSRGSGTIVDADMFAPQVLANYISPYGTQITPTENTGDVSCMLAVEVPAASGAWSVWMPTSGVWPTNTGGSAKQAMSWNPNYSAYIRGGSYIPMMRAVVGTAASIPAGVGANLPEGFALGQNYPNPFVPQAGTTLNFSLNQDGPASINIYDAIGRYVRTLADGKLIKGIHSVEWDGRDARGQFVHSGIYLCTLSSDGRSVSVRLMVLE